MSRRKSNDGHIRETADTGRSSAYHLETYYSGATSHASYDAAAPTLFYSEIPLADPATPVVAWLRFSITRAIRIGACLSCGARYEEVVDARKPLVTPAAFERFAKRVGVASENMRAFAAEHSDCPGTHRTVVGCRETLWSVPATVPARARFWVDEVLDDVLLSPESGPGSRLAVLARHDDGREERRNVPIPPLPAALSDDQVEHWLRANLHGLIAACGGRLEAVMVVVRGTQVSTVLGPPTAAGAFVVTPRGAFAGMLPFGVDIPTTDAAKDSFVIWQPLVIPSAVVDGLFAVPSR